MRRVRDLVAAMGAIAPLALAEAWDNVGLIAGDAEDVVSGVLLTIDLTPAVVAEAVARRCSAVVAYHPPIFEGLKRIEAGTAVHGALRAGLAIYSPHTALDAAEGGVNDFLADAAGVTRGRRSLREGAGRVGELKRAATVAEVVGRVKGALGVGYVLVSAGDGGGEVARVAVCAGSGRGLLDEVIAAGAGLYVTGELPHHDALRAARAGVTVVCTLHSASERPYLKVLGRRLGEALEGVAVVVSTFDREPFEVV